MTSIRRADPTAPDIQSVIAAHLAHSWAATPQTSCHTMTVEELAAEPGLQFWAIYEDDAVLGCGALKDIGEGLAEVKSVHVLESARGRGLARHIMAHLETEARTSGYVAMVLETGSDVLPAYDAARALYERLGFTYCEVLPGYRRDPNSAFMRRDL